MNVFINPNVAKQTFHISVNIYEFIHKHFGRNHEMTAWKDFLDSDPEDYPMNENWMNIFIVWYIYSWKRFEYENPALEYMVENYSQLSEIEKAFIGSCISNKYSFYVVNSVEPGRHLEISDLFSKEKYLVFETKASRTLTPGTIIFSKVASVQNLNFLVGTGTTSIDNSHLGQIKLLAKNRKWRTHELSRISLYFNIVAEMILSDQAAE